jgi:hypothetical protein
LKNCNTILHLRVKQLVLSILSFKSLPMATHFPS